MLIFFLLDFNIPNAHSKFTYDQPFQLAWFKTRPKLSVLPRVALRQFVSGTKREQMMFYI